MADNSVLTDAGQFEQQFRRSMGRVRCSMPGTIISFDPTRQRASVLPGVRMKIVQGTDVEYVDLPEITNVPIVTPYGYAGKVCLTHPIKAGDPCELIFSDRSIDNFLETGASANPDAAENNDTTTPRAHHLSDAICIPGLIADPQILPEWNQENIELRDFDRRVYFSLGPQGITMTDGTAVYTMQGGKVTLDAPNGIEETASIASRRTEGNNAIYSQGVATLQGSNVAIGRDGHSGAGTINEIDWSLRSRYGTFIDTNGRDSTAHYHSGVDKGPDNTGPTAG